MAEFVVVSQYVIDTHGQGRINAELIRGLIRRQHTVRVLASYLAEDLQHNPSVAFDRISISPRLPTNWAKCEVFRNSAESRLRRSNLLVDINNGAAAVVRSRVNVAMFVHNAWRTSKWRRKWWRSPQAFLEAAFTLQQCYLERRAFAMAERVVALSHGVQQELVEHCDLNTSSVVTINPGVDTQVFTPCYSSSDGNPLRRQCGIADRDARPLAIFVGDIRSRRKNLDLVLNAIVQRNDWLLVVVGSFDRSPYCTEARTIGIADRVFFIGHQPRVHELLPYADLFVFPSHYEPFGLVVIEALASGLPVVVTKQTGSSFAVEHGTNGWVLTNGGDLAGMLRALDKFENVEIRRWSGIKARESALQYTWDRMAQSYLDLLGDQ